MYLFDIPIPIQEVKRTVATGRTETHRHKRSGIQNNDGNARTYYYLHSRSVFIYLFDILIPIQEMKRTVTEELKRTVTKELNRAEVKELKRTVTKELKRTRNLEKKKKQLV